MDIAGNGVTFEHAGDFLSSPSQPPTRVDEPVLLATIVLPRELVPDVVVVVYRETSRGEKVEALDTEWVARYVAMADGFRKLRLYSNFVKDRL